MTRSLRMFLIGLLLGIGATVAATEQKIGFARTEEGFKITYNTHLIEKTRELPEHIVEFVVSNWHK